MILKKENIYYIEETINTYMQLWFGCLNREAHCFKKKNTTNFSHSGNVELLHQIVFFSFSSLRTTDRVSSHIIGRTTNCVSSLSSTFKCSCLKVYYSIKRNQYMDVLYKVAHFWIAWNKIGRYFTRVTFKMKANRSRSIDIYT